jgi:hypothetical protein
MSMWLEEVGQEPGLRKSWSNTTWFFFMWVYVINIAYAEGIRDLHHLRITAAVTTIKPDLLHRDRTAYYYTTLHFQSL